MKMVFISIVCLDIINNDMPLYLKAQYYYITDIFVLFRINSMSLHYLFASKRLYAPWGQGPCLIHLCVSSI